MINSLRNKFNPVTTLIVVHLTILVLVLGLLVVHKGKPRPSQDKILVIPIEGVISMKRGSMGRGQSVDSIVKTLKNVREEKDIKAVILRINSPGGSVGAVQEIYHALEKVKEEGIPIVSSFGDISASGGYYVACGSDYIFAQPGTLTGSIGVIMQLPQLQGLLKKVGVEMRTIKSGNMKDTGSPFRDMSVKERSYFQKIISNTYQQFYAVVKKARKLDDSVLEKLADGRIFNGQMAYENKLIDGLGGYEEAIAKAKELAGLSGKTPRIITSQGKKGLERILDMMNKSPVNAVQEWANQSVQLQFLLQ